MYNVSENWRGQNRIEIELRYELAVCVVPGKQ